MMLKWNPFQQWSRSMARGNKLLDSVVPEKHPSVWSKHHYSLGDWLQNAGSSVLAKMLVRFPVPAFSPWLTGHNCIVDYVNTGRLLYLVALWMWWLCATTIMRISISVLDSMYVSIYEHRISFVWSSFLLLFVLSLLFLTGECWNTPNFDCFWPLQLPLLHCKFATNLLVLHPFSPFLHITYFITNLQEYNWFSHSHLFILLFYKLALLESTQTCSEILQDRRCVTTLLTQSKVQLTWEYW